MDIKAEFCALKAHLDTLSEAFNHMEQLASVYRNIGDSL